MRFIHTFEHKKFEKNEFNYDYIVQSIYDQHRFGTQYPFHIRRWNFWTILHAFTRSIVVSCAISRNKNWHRISKEKTKIKKMKLNNRRFLIYCSVVCSKWADDTREPFVINNQNDEKENNKIHEYMKKKKKKNCVNEISHMFNVRERDNHRWWQFVKCFNMKLDTFWQARANKIYEQSIDINKIWNRTA